MLGVGEALKVEVEVEDQLHIALLDDEGLTSEVDVSVSQGLSFWRLKAWLK